MAGKAIKSAAATAPTREALEARATQLFEGIKGGAVPRAPFAAVSKGIAADAAEGGMDSILTPSAARVAGKIDDIATGAGDDIAMRDLNILRRQAQIPAQNFANKTEARIGSRMISAIDEFVDESSAALGAQGREARQMWTRLRKMDDIDEIFRKADLSASGMANGLRVEFRRILKNPKLRNGYTKAEQEAMRRVVSPGPLQTIINQAGKFGFALDRGGSSAVGGGMGIGLGSLFGGTVGAVAIPALGTAARRGSEMLTERAAKRVADVVRAPQANIPALTNQARGVLDELLLRGGRGAAIGSSRATQ
jgi:hypothetical protein